MLPIDSLANFLEEKHDQYNTPNFIADDPISVAHRFSKKEDIEVAGFFAATLAWGRRASIVNSGNRLMDKMGNSPHEFILHASMKDLRTFSGVVHRTFNSVDLLYFCAALKEIYLQHGGLEAAFSNALSKSDSNTGNAISGFRAKFFSLPHESRTEKHVSNPGKGSASKRLNMFLRWMVRSDKRGVDFGIWRSIKPAQLVLPLDVHTARVSRSLGLLQRKQNDWQAAAELTERLKSFDKSDPVKYDFALFGLGMHEQF